MAEVSEESGMLFVWHAPCSKYLPLTKYLPVCIPSKNSHCQILFDPEKLSPHKLLYSLDNIVLNDLWIWWSKLLLPHSLLINLLPPCLLSPHYHRWFGCWIWLNAGSFWSSSTSGPTLRHANLTTNLEPYIKAWL